MACLKMFPETGSPHKYPCGTCPNCVSAKAGSRALQNWLEYLQSDGNAFSVTLTFSEEKLPKTQYRSSVAVYAKSELERLDAIGRTYKYRDYEVIPYHSASREQRDSYDHTKYQAIFDSQRARMKRENGIDFISTYDMRTLNKRIADKWKNQRKPVAFIDAGPGAPEITRNQLSNWRRRFMRLCEKKKLKVSTYVVGEYGEATGRPHGHANIFLRPGSRPMGDKRLWREIVEVLEETWKNGTIRTKSFHPRSADYLSEYIGDKAIGSNACRNTDDHAIVRVDGSHPEFGFGKVGMNYTKKLADAIRQSAVIYAGIDPKIRKEVEDFAEAKIRGEATAEQLSHVMALPGIGEAELKAVIELSTFNRGRLTAMMPWTDAKGHRKKTYPMSNYFRKKVLQEIGLTESEIESLSQRRTESVRRTWESMSDEEKQAQIDDMHQRARVSEKRKEEKIRRRRSKAVGS